MWLLTSSGTGFWSSSSAFFATTVWGNTYKLISTILPVSFAKGSTSSNLATDRADAPFGPEYSSDDCGDGPSRWLDVARQGSGEYRNTELWALASIRSRIQADRFYQESPHGADRAMGLALELIDVPLVRVGDYVTEAYEELDYLMDSWYIRRPGAESRGLAGELCLHDPDIFDDYCRAFDHYDKEVTAFCSVAANIVLHLYSDRAPAILRIFQDLGWPTPPSLTGPDPEVSPPSDAQIVEWTAVPPIVALEDDSTGSSGD